MQGVTNKEIIQDTDMQDNRQTVLIYNDAGNAEDEADFLKRIKSRESAHKPDMDILIKNQEDNEKYYYAEYIDENLLTDDQARIQIPKLFENLETLIPLTTRQTPEPNLTVLPKNKNSSTKLEKLLRAHLTDKWQLSEQDDGLEMQPKAEENMRNLFSQRVMIYKVIYKDIETDHKGNFLGGCPLVVPVRLEDCCFPTDARNEEEMAFFIHYTRSTYGELIKKFPDKAEKLKEIIGNSNDDISEDSVVKHIEYWENEYVAWSYEDLFLGKEKNPYYNWKNKAFNHFKKPRKPIIMETDIRHGKGIMGRTTFIEMSKTLAENLDKRKRYIDRNAKLSNGLIIVNQAGGVTKENAQLLGRDLDQTVFLEDGDINNAVKILTASSIDQAVVNDMLHDEKHIDMITGINDTLRGERTAQETAEGRKLLKESALGRLEVMFRMNERVGQKIYNWMIQFLYVFTPESGMRVYGAEIETGANETMTREMLKKVKILCYVKDGSTFPKDKMTTQTEAVELFKLGQISNVDSLKMREMPDAEGMAYRNYLEKSNPPALYDPTQKQTAFDPMAITHTYDLLKGMDVQPANLQDLKQMRKHLDAHQAWLDGKQLDEGLPFVADVDVEQLRAIREHIQTEAETLAKMIALTQSMPMTPQDPAMMQQGQAPIPIDPTAQVSPQPQEMLVPPVDMQPV